MVALQDFTVAWVCALPDSELRAAVKMLDERHPPVPLPQGDPNTYIFGEINHHNVVIACLPVNYTGPVSTAHLIYPLKQSFPNLQIYLLVGIGGGVPYDPPSINPLEDLYLGDVVVGVGPWAGAPAVIPWDFQRYLSDGKVELMGYCDNPDYSLTNALSFMIANEEFSASCKRHLQRISPKGNQLYPGTDQDKLFESRFKHVGHDQNRCANCDLKQLCRATPKNSRGPSQFTLHKGTIASGSGVMSDGERRDIVRKTLTAPVRCFEMEAAGMMNSTRALVIRGIWDYADSHKNDLWKPYAAATAAAVGRQFLYTIQPHAKEGAS